MADQCVLMAAAAGNPEEFNMPLKAGGIAVVLVVSSLACMVPVIALRISWLNLPKKALFAARHFGTGVLIATAFVHLLPTAFIALQNPCLPAFWTTDYPAMPGAIAMVAVFFITVIQLVFSRGQKICGTQIELGHAEAGIRPGRSGIVGNRSNCDDTTFIVPVENVINTTGRKSTGAHDHSQKEVEHQAHHEDNLSPEIQHRRQLLQCMLLEVGILFHSVFIGMALSVIGNDDFGVLLAAIVFHQSFEGLALGARIAQLKFPKNQRIRPWLMCMAYGVTTPIGQVIGIATQSFYNQQSTVGLLMVGIMNSISAGLLIFASLVELLSEDFLSREAERLLPGKKVWGAAFLVFLGAFAMSFVGAYA